MSRVRSLYGDGNNTKTKLGVAGILCFFLLYLTLGSKSEAPQSVQQGAKKASSMSKDIVMGTIKHIPYYHCGGGQGTGNSVRHLVLLHGAAFTKENWKESGILDQFCKVPNLVVSAMDLPVSAGHVELTSLLQAMQGEQLISSTHPIALVTPSASGRTMIDWMTQGSVAEIPNFVDKWIPVATVGLSKATDEQVKSLTTVDGLSILAVYGNRDKAGKVVSERLQSLAEAKLVELEGGHPCYLDSPDAFVQTVLEFLGMSK
jgi:pimeloyl-ACP methyl ester carboxylesterase